MIANITISSSRMTVQKGADGIVSRALPGLYANKNVRARVLNILAGQKAELEINGQKVVAKTNILLTPGEEINLKILVEKDAVILKLINPSIPSGPESRSIAGLVRFFSGNRFLPGPGDLKGDNIKKLIYAMALKSGRADEDFLPCLIKNSGILWEKKLAGVLLDSDYGSNTMTLKNKLAAILKQDIKGSLMQAQALLENDSSADSPSLKAASDFVKTIENYQIVNHYTQDSGRLFLPFPVLNNSGFNFGHLFIDTGRSSNEDTGGNTRIIRISFLLDMTHLGALRADFSIFKKEISGRFMLEDKSACDYVKSMIPELKQRIVKIGYRLKNMDCIVAGKDKFCPDHFAESVLKSCESENRMLNIVI